MGISLVWVWEDWLDAETVMAPETLPFWLLLLFVEWLQHRDRNLWFPSGSALTYDGDGKRVKSDITTHLGTTTTYFVGNHYEVTDGVVTKYYYAGSQRIAMRDNGTLFFLLGDHLGSTSLVTFGNGNVVSETRYKAWGEVRYASGTTPTDYTYTGQYSDSYINLLWYGSRHYDPALGRFISPDTIVPTTTQGVQAYDRYAYANNNPVLYNDPSGHCVGPFAIACIAVAVVGLTVAMSQVPSDVPQANPADWGNENVFWAGISAVPVMDAIVSTAQCATSGCDPVTYTMTLLPGPNPNTVANAADDLADDVVPAQTTVIVPDNTNTSIVAYYPPHMGAAEGGWEATEAYQGQILGRFGGDEGNYFSEPGTPWWQLALPNGQPSRPERLFQVDKPFPMYVSDAAPWFNQPGGGIQCRTLKYMTLKWLVEHEYLIPAE